KSEVRELAQKAKIPVFDKKDSQGVCFIGHIDMKEFLKGYIDTTPGDVLDTDGNVIGSHEGALLYTIGERHGFTLFKQHTDQKRMYIIAKDIEKNTLTVSGEVEAKDTNVSVEKNRTVIPVGSMIVIRRGMDRLRKALMAGTLECRIRYRQKKISVHAIKTEAHGFSVGLCESQLVSTGQSIVFYSGPVCLGGGIIVEANKVKGKLA
ncbi:MAG: hypothetical protein RJB39_339, partial [Candidatus Parcubacteria bacterium]